MAIRTFFPLVIDSTMMMEYDDCPMSFFRRYLQHLSKGYESTDLVAGKAFARGLEVTRKAYYNQDVPEQEAVAMGIAALFEDYGDHTPMSGVKTPEKIAAALELYFIEYPLAHDRVKPARLENGEYAIEYSFAHELPFEHPDIPGMNVIITGRADMLGEYADRLWVVDEKTTGAAFSQDWSKQWDTRGQFSTYCLTPEHEVLTEKGWVSLAELEKGVSVACWDKGSIFFEQPYGYVEKDFSGTLKGLSGKVNILGTPDHRQVVWDEYSKKYKTYTLETLPKKSGALRLLSAGLKSDGETLDADFVKLLVAMQADGTWRNDYKAIEFKFIKERKINRLVSLLLALGVEYSEKREADHSCRIRINMDQPIVEILLSYLGKGKNFGSWLLDFSAESLKIFVEELQYWDGYTDERTSSSWLYITTNAENASWVRTAASLCGHYTSEHFQETKENWKPCFRIVISQGHKHSIQNLRREEVPYAGKVYCVNVPSSYFLVRFRNTIMVTGNCWGLKKDGIKVAGAYIRGVYLGKVNIKFNECQSIRSDWQTEMWEKQMLAKLQQILKTYNDWKASGLHPSEYFFGNWASSCMKYFRPCQFQDLCRDKNSEKFLESQYDQYIWLPHLQKREKLDIFLESIGEFYNANSGNS